MLSFTVLLSCMPHEEQYRFDLVNSRIKKISNWFSITRNQLLLEGIGRYKVRKVGSCAAILPS